MAILALFLRSAIRRANDDDSLLPQKFLWYAHEVWLAHETPSETLAALLVPHSPHDMRAYLVSKEIGTVQNQSAALIEPAGADEPCVIWLARVGVVKAGEEKLGVASRGGPRPRPSSFASDS